jgi:exosortase K
MKLKISTRWVAQSVAVLVCALALKQFYSTTSADQLKWILMPTTVCVELLSGESFDFESHSGYLSADHRFLIASSCAGVNFLLTAFLMLAARRLLFESNRISWSFIPVSLVAAYFVTLIANTTRILIALKMQGMSAIGFFDSNQLHRLEGVFIYFLFLALLFLISERNNEERTAGLMRRCLLPLFVYYATMLGIPLVNGAYRTGWSFWEYSIVVLLVPIVVLCSAGFAVLWVFARTSNRNSGFAQRRKGPQSTQRKKRINSLLREECIPSD